MINLMMLLSFKVDLQDSVMVHMEREKRKEEIDNISEESKVRNKE